MLVNNIMTQVHEPIKASSVVKYWLIAPSWFISPYLLGLILPPVYWKRLLLLTTHLPTFFLWRFIIKVMKMILRIVGLKNQS